MKYRILNNRDERIGTVNRDGVLLALENESD